MKATREKQCQMLQIALAPAPIASGKVRKGGRSFLIATTHCGRHVDRPAAAAHEGGLDEVMAQYVATEWLASAEFGQACMFGKGADPNNGIMPPVVTFGALPPCDPRR